MMTDAATTTPTDRDRVLEIAREFPGLKIREAPIPRDGLSFLAIWNRNHLPGLPPDSLGWRPAIRFAFRDDGALADWECLNGDCGYPPRSAAEEHGLGAWLAAALPALAAFQMPDRFRGRSLLAFEDVIIEKGPDGLYRERPATEADAQP